MEIVGKRKRRFLASLIPGEPASSRFGEPSAGSPSSPNPTRRFSQLGMAGRESTYDSFPVRKSIVPYVGCFFFPSRLLDIIVRNLTLVFDVIASGSPWSVEQSTERGESLNSLSLDTSINVSPPVLKTHRKS